MVGYQDGSMIFPNIGTQFHETHPTKPGFLGLLKSGPEAEGWGNIFEPRKSAKVGISLCDPKL